MNSCFTNGGLFAELNSEWGTSPPDVQVSINPLTPKCDWHLISPYNVTPESNIKVIRIKETITC